MAFFFIRWAAVKLGVGPPRTELKKITAVVSLLLCCKAAIISTFSAVTLDPFLFFERITPLP